MYCACRSNNEMIFAMLFISMVGLGPFAGVLALFMHTLGMLAKLFSEAIDWQPHPPSFTIRSHDCIFAYISKFVRLRWLQARDKT